MAASSSLWDEAPLVHSSLFYAFTGLHFWHSGSKYIQPFCHMVNWTQASWGLFFQSTLSADKVQIRCLTSGSLLPDFVYVLLCWFSFLLRVHNTTVNKVIFSILSMFVVGWNRFSGARLMFRGMCCFLNSWVTCVYWAADHRMLQQSLFLKMLTLPPVSLPMSLVWSAPPATVETRSYNGKSPPNCCSAAEMKAWEAKQNCNHTVSPSTQTPNSPQAPQVQPRPTVWTLLCSLCQPYKTPGMHTFFLRHTFMQPIYSVVILW